METSLDSGPRFILKFLISPHSLGTLIEWKRAKVKGFTLGIYISPHSLGTLIEWKPHY